jgi:hypothetical protein
LGGGLGYRLIPAFLACLIDQLTDAPFGPLAAGQQGHRY